MSQPRVSSTSELTESIPFDCEAKSYALVGLLRAYLIEVVSQQIGSASERIALATLYVSSLPILMLCPLILQPLSSLSIIKILFVFTARDPDI